MSCCAIPFPLDCCVISCCTDCACRNCGESCHPLLADSTPGTPRETELQQFDDPKELFASIHSDSNLVERIGQEALAWTMTQGITMLKHTQPSSSDSPATNEGPKILHAPTTLLPYRLDRNIYEQVKELSQDFSQVYERVARDVEFLKQTLGPAAVKDEFLSNLLRTLDEADALRTTWTKQETHLAINRSDYLMHHMEEQMEQEDDNKHKMKPQQVEFNTISAGAGSLSDKTSEMHRFLIERYLKRAGGKDLHFDLPSNSVITNITGAMNQAHKTFLKQFPLAQDDRTETVVLFVTQANEANMADQRALEYALFSEHSLPVVRITLPEVLAKTELDASGKLWLKANVENGNEAQLVSLVYFRAGYTPRDFPSNSEWQALTHLEASVAIKCPSTAYHLAGCKKVQQVLSDPDVLERFTSSPEQAERIRAVFTDLFRASSSEAIQEALANPEDFVLKPQREGGGNNLWGSELVQALQTKTKEELDGFILMRKIRTFAKKKEISPSALTDASSSPSSLSSPSPSSNLARAALKFGKVAMVQRPLSELGMMSACLTTTDAAGELKFLSNQYLGYLVRTKCESLNEGGLMSGAGAIDSLVLV